VLPVFNHAEWLAQWKNDNPEVVIPEAVVEENDKDWYMNAEEEEAIIAVYFQQKESVGGQQPPATK